VELVFTGVKLNHVIIGLGHLAAAKEFNFSAGKVVVMIASLTQQEWHLSCLLKAIQELPSHLGLEL